MQLALRENNSAILLSQPGSWTSHSPSLPLTPCLTSPWAEDGMGAKREAVILRLRSALSSSDINT